jgi:hypothetical protein
MSKIVLAALAAMVLVPSAASAATYSQGTLGQYGTGEKLFANFDDVNPLATSFNNAAVLNGDVQGQGAAVNDTNYLAVFGGGSVSYNFAPSGVKSFSFDAGTIDAYNSITIDFLGGASQTLDGQNLVGQTLRAMFTADGKERITGVTFASTTNSFEVDNISVGGAVPEPASWALMIAGMGAVGGSLRSRRARGTLAVA